MSRQIDLDSLATKAPVLSTKLAASHAEACSVCLDIEGHSSGVSLRVDFDGSNYPVTIVWKDAVTDEIRRAHADHEVRVSNGAYAVALLLMPEFAGLRAVDISLKWNGVDYFLAPDDQEEHLIFNHSAVLEVSGIQKENAKNTLDGRVRRKIRRLEDYRTRPGYQTVDLPTYQCVVEFSRPKSRVVGP